MKKEEIVFTETCTVCNKKIKILRDFDYIDDDGVCRAVKSEEGTHMCDYAISSGCFKTYHDKCFDQHECPAHKPKQ